MPGAILHKNKTMLNLLGLKNFNEKRFQPDLNLIQYGSEHRKNITGYRACSRC